MATYSEIQTRVLRRLIDLPAAVQAEVPKLVNTAMRSLQKAHNFFAMQTSLQYTTVVGTRLLSAVPATFKEFRGKPVYLRMDGSIGRMVVANVKEDIWPQIDEDDEGSPLVILRENTGTIGTGQFLVYPLPDGNSDYTDGEYRINIPIYSYLADLVNGTDTNWFTENAEEYLVDKTTAEGFSVDWDTEHELIWTARAENWKKEVIRADKYYRLSTTETLVPKWQGVHASSTEE